MGCKTRAGVITLLLLAGPAACGDDDGSGGPIGAADASGGDKGSAGAPEQSMAEIRDLVSNPIEVDDLGDEAFFDGSSLWFRSGPITFSVTAYFSFDEASDAEGQEKLLTLARQVLARA